MVRFARISLLPRNPAGVLMQGFLALLAFMAYGCACVPVGHSDGDSHIDRIAASHSYSAVAFGHVNCGNGGHRCHDDLPVGFPADTQAEPHLSSRSAPAFSHVLPMIGWVNAEASGRERSPPAPSRARHLEVCRTAATALAVLCVFRS